MADTAGAPPAANGSSTSKLTPTPEAAAQPPTHYHSLFSDLVSWKNPRDSAVAYASIVSAIVAVRYLDIIRWTFKLTWISLAIAVTAETSGKLLLNHGLASQFRPRQYHTVSRETVDALVGNVHELINFFFIEAQRILYAENVYVSAAAASAAFIAYFLIKLVPFWGLAIIGTTVAFFVPLIYNSNQELIDHHLKNASEAINAQTAQVRSAAQKQADHLTAVGKQYAGDYTVKVQELLRGSSVSPSPAKKVPEFPSPPTEEPQRAAEPAVADKEPVAA